MKALNRPAAGEEDPFMKKEIVIGTMGKTQGVRSIAKPHKMASMISPQSPEALSDPSEGSEIAELCESPLTDCGSVLETLLFNVVTFLLMAFSAPGTTVSSALSVTEKSQSSGLAQNWSLHAVQVTYPPADACGAVTRTFCPSLNMPKKTGSPFRISGWVMSYSPPSSSQPSRFSNVAVVADSSHFVP